MQTAMIFLLALSFVAMQQSGVADANIQEALAACSEIEDPPSRLQCFDSLATQSAKPARPNDPAPLPEKARSATSSPVAAPIGGESQTPKSPGAVERTASASDKQKRRSSPELASDAPGPQRDAFEAVIEEVWLRFDKIYVRLDNGEVWKQTSRDRPRLPKPGQRARFEKGTFGGWFVRFDVSSSRYSFTRVE